MEIEPSAEQDNRTTSRSGLDRRQRAQQHYEKSQVRLANILAYADKNASTPRSRYRLAQEHVRAEKNSEVTELFKTTVEKPPDTPARRTPVKEEGSSEEIQRPELRGKKTNPKMAEGLEKLIATVEDMNKRLQDYEVRNKTLARDLRDANAKLASIEKASEKGTETAMKHATEISTKVMDKLAEPKPYEVAPSKLQPYRSGDFQIWAERFEGWSANWNNERKLNELINLLQGPAEDVLRTRRRLEWTAETLLEACRDRLTPGYSISQIELELSQMTEQPGQTPLEVMTRVEEITRKADNEIETSTLDQLKRAAFMRLMVSHKPMYHYINRNAKSRTDPYEALRLAKEYVRDHGYQDQHIISLTSQIIQNAGIHLQGGILPAHQVGGNTDLANMLQIPLANQVKFGSNPELSKSCVHVNRQAAANQLPSKSVCQFQDLAIGDDFVEARYLEKGHKPTPDELCYRLNECERFRRDFKWGEIYPGYGNEQKAERGRGRGSRGNYRGNQRGESNGRGWSQGNKREASEPPENNYGKRGRGDGFRGRSRYNGPSRARGMPSRVTVEHYYYDDDGALVYDTQPEGMEFDEGNYEDYQEPE